MMSAYCIHLSFSYRKNVLSLMTSTEGTAPNGEHAMENAISSEYCLLTLNINSAYSSGLSRD